MSRASAEQLAHRPGRDFSQRQLQAGEQRETNYVAGSDAARFGVLRTQAQHLLRSFNTVTLKHLRREANRRTDELCNRVLDASMGRERAPGAPGKSARPATSGSSKPETVSDERVRADCVASLRSAAKEWATSGGLGRLQPEQVWDQLWSIVRESGLLKERKSR